MHNEAVLPKERGSRCGFDRSSVYITCYASNDTTDNKTHDDVCVLQEGSAEDFLQNDAHKQKKSETDEFRRVPSKLWSAKSIVISRPGSLTQVDGAH